MIWESSTNKGTVCCAELPTTNQFCSINANGEGNPYAVSGIQVGRMYQKLSKSFMFLPKFYLLFISKLCTNNVNSGINYINNVISSVINKGRRAFLSLQPLEVTYRDAFTKISRSKLDSSL